MSGIILDVLRAGVTDVMLLVLLFTMGRPKYKEKWVYGVAMLGMLLINLAANTYFYLRGDYGMVARVDVAMLLLACVVGKPFFKEELMPWLFNFISVLNIYGAIVFTSYWISSFSPAPPYANVFWRLVLFAVVIYLFRHFIRPFYSDIVVHWHVYFWLVVVLATNYGYYYLVNESIDQMIENSLVPLLLLTVLTVVVFISIFLSLQGLIAEYGLRENMIKSRANDEIRETKRMLETLVANIKGGIITCVLDSRTHTSKVTYINEGWAEMTGYTQDELNLEMGGNPQALLLPEDKAEADRAYAEQVARGSEYELIYRVKKKNGAIIWVIDRGITSILENEDLQNQSIITEVTEIKVQEEYLKRLAQIDTLTSLYNRGTAMMLAEKALEVQPQKLHAAMVIDIDYFKGINDSMGHAFGDAVLREVAGRLKELFRMEDILGRLGGDEFVIFMPDVLSMDAAEKKAAAVCEAVRAIKIGSEKHPPVSVSLGVALSTEGMSWQTFYEQADAALYKAKHMGRNQYCIEVRLES